MSELKPCPFCGGEVENQPDSLGLRKAKCLDCHAEAPIAAWDTRTESIELSQLRKELEESRELLKCCQEYIEDVPVLREGIRKEVAKLNQSGE